MAVATSVLSKPWQHLWTLVPAIDHFFDGYSHPETFEGSVITKVFDGNKAPTIRRLSLSVYTCRVSYLDKWLSSAADRNVEELDLDFQSIVDDYYYVDGDPGPNIFAFCRAPESCKTLVVMKLLVYCDENIEFVIGEHLHDLYFPILKILHINSVLFESRDPSLSGIFSSQFPLLEELVVVFENIKCYDHDINISLPKLRRLQIKRFRSQSILHVEAPNLQRLVLRRFHSGGFRVEHLHNLVEADVDVSYYNERDNKNYEYGESLINFVNALSNVRMLNISFHTMQQLSSHSFFHADRIQPFHNLVELDLHLDDSVFGIMMDMLPKFENLEHLKITEDGNRYSKAKYCFAPPTHVPNCLTYRLKTFCFREFGCSKYEMEFVVYILKNSLVLEKVKILFCSYLVWKTGRCSEKILSTTSRGSLECKFEFDQELSENEYHYDSSR